MTSPRRHALRTVLPWTVALFLAVLLVMVVELRTGRGPGATNAAATAVTTPARRQVTVRRYVIKRVVVHLPGEADEGGGRTVTRLAAVPVTTSAPVTSASTASAPAPAPAPAPLTSHTS
jgi:hypothetical protein